MKNCNKNVEFIAMFICSCSKWDDDSQMAVLPSNWITPCGGVLTAFDGQVTLIFPEDAVDSPLEIKVNRCLDGKDCDFLLSPVSVDPVILFNKLVEVRIKYDGELTTSATEIPENLLLTATVWKSEADFLNNQSYTNCICTVDYDGKTITFCICNSGIIAIGPEPGTELN